MNRLSRTLALLRLTGGSSYTHRVEFLSALGWAYLTLGFTLNLDLLAGTSTSDSPSLRWVFTVLPVAVWGPIFTVVGIAALLATRGRRLLSPSFRRHAQALAFSLAMLLAACWALGLLAAAFSGDLLAAYGPIVWTLLVRVIYLEALPEPEPEMETAMSGDG